MGERLRARSRSGFRHSRRLRRDRRGVVAVIGTLLSLLVFFALFGVFLTQYVPLWMTQNESQLANGLVGSLATLKSGVDDQYLLGDIPSYSVPFTVSSQSVPLFAQPTVATLAYLAGCTSGFSASGTPVTIASCVFQSVAYTDPALSGDPTPHGYGSTAPTNYLAVSVPNRYYPPVGYYFENDGVLGISSTVHQWMVLPPPINVSKTTGNLSIQTSQLVLLGNASSFTSVGSKEVSSHLLARSQVSSVGRFLTASDAARAFTFTMTMGVYGLCGWYNYLENTTAAALGSPGASHGWWLNITSSAGSVTPPLSQATCIAAASSTYDLKLTVLSVNYAVSFVAEASLSFNAGGL